MKVGRKQAGGDWPELPAMEPLTVEIVKPIEYLDGEYKDKPNPQVRVPMVVIAPEEFADAKNPGKVWGTHGRTLGKRKDGTASLLRQLVMAAHDHDLDDDELYDFDLDDLVGHKLIVIGNYKEGDQDKTYLRPIAYTRLNSRQRARSAETASKSEPAPEAKADREPAAAAKRAAPDF
jgi:hypothetical protein